MMPRPALPSLDELPAAWRASAVELRRWGAAGHAETLEQAARELSAALAADRDAVLNLEQAARESGFSADHLGKLVRAGRIPNAGRALAPKIRRGDLPRKAGVLPSAPGRGMSRVQIARSVVTSTQEPHDAG
jgi:hypothetical protein